MYGGHPSCITFSPKQRMHAASGERGISNRLTFSRENSRDNSRSDTSNTQTRPLVTKFRQQNARREQTVASIKADEKKKTPTCMHLVVGGESVDGTDQIIHEHGVENPAFQELFVSPVAHNDLVRSLHLEPDLQPTKTDVPFKTDFPFIVSLFHHSSFVRTIDKVVKRCNPRRCGAMRYCWTCPSLA